jgi:glucose-6-phosphate isomerase
MLKFDDSYMYADAIGEHGISSSTQNAFWPTGIGALDRLFAEVDQRRLGFLNLLDSERVLSEIDAINSDLFSTKHYIVFVGIGGSDLGGKVIHSILKNRGEKHVIFTGSSTDPDSMDALLSEIRLEDTAFCFISRSGETIETLAYYAYIKQACLDTGLTLPQHMMVITDSSKGSLRAEAESLGLKSLSVSSDVNGRFSVLSSVGLLPALVLGHSPEGLLKGALDALHDFMDQGEEGVVFKIAWGQFLLKQQGIDLVTFFPYRDSLVALGMWLRQLWAETLGKETTGILPVVAKGPSDQHSQLQFFNQGKMISSYFFFNTPKIESSYVIRPVEIDGLKLNKELDLSELLEIEQEATIKSLIRNGRPVAQLEMSEMNEVLLGYIFLTFELSVVLLAYLLNVDPFTQPGVEDSKIYIKQMLF